jgi:glutamyl-tRNA synthetase
MTVRTRFAPSPTGYLHIGGVRTALFNWLFAKKHGGQFILRIDDTDEQRNVKEALAPILHGFRWLGLDWDEGAEVGGPHGPYYQSQKGDRYKEVVKQLVERGVAYYDYATTDEMKVERETAEKAKASFSYSRNYASWTDEGKKRAAEGKPGTVRLKMPREGSCKFRDHIRGDMDVPWASEQDHTIARADGSVLYNLANIVDDYDMQITHVIRAEEHLSNTPRQIFMIDALGWKRPEYAHVPFVAEPGSKNKLSKRKIAKYCQNKEFAKVFEHGLRIAANLGCKEMIPAGELLVQLSAGGGIMVEELKEPKEGLPGSRFNPVVADFYEQLGYLPDAIINYLVLLGWSLDDKSEFFTRQQMIDLFSLERVNKAPASLDVKKLFAFQEKYMQDLPIEKKVAMAMPFVEKVGWAADRAKIETIIRAAGDRIKVAGDILDYGDFFAADDQLAFDEAAFDKRLRKPAEAKPLLGGYAEKLRATSPFDVPTLEKTTNDFVQAENIKLNDIIHALRVAVTGKAIGFGMFETLALLGKDRCLARIDQALKRV